MINKELTGSGVRIIGSRHRYRSAHIAQTVASLVDDRVARWLLHQIGIKPPALYHKSGYHPMKDQTVVKTIIGIGHEVVHRDGRIVGV